MNLHYVLSKENLADEPSRQLNKSDATLHTGIWHKIQEQFGGGTGHRIDLMSVDSNTMTDYNGKILKHFTPYPTPLSAGVNCFLKLWIEGRIVMYFLHLLFYYQL